MTTSPAQSVKQASLYERVGGYEAIYRMAANGLRRAMQDPVIGRYWQHMSESSFKREHINFVDFLVAQWGGPDNYRGRDMITTHRGMGITDEHWDALMNCIEAGQVAASVPDDLAQEIKAFFRKFKPVVAGSPSFRDVVLAHPEMDITKGMQSVGVVWPERKI